MAITITETLTIEEYLGVFPQDSAVEEDIIQGAINNANITLDTICGGMITKVWGVIDPEDPLYRTEAEHNCIKQAVAKQTQYLVSKNLDMSAGSESYTSGSNSYNETRPKADLVVDDTIYQLLAQARVYNPNITTDTSFAGSTNNLNQGFYDPSYDPASEYVTYAVGDNRYILKHNETGTEKFLYNNADGNIEYVEIKFSPTGTSSAAANFVTINGVEWALGGVSGGTKWGEISGHLEDQTDLHDALTNLELYCDSLDATKAAADSVYTKYNGEEGTEYSTCYNVSEVNGLIATSSANFVGTFTGGETRPESFDYDTFVKSQTEGMEITNNDYCYVVWTQKGEYDRCKYNANENLWSFEFSFDGDVSFLEQKIDQEIEDRQLSDITLQTNIDAVESNKMTTNTTQTITGNKTFTPSGNEKDIKVYNSTWSALTCGVDDDNWVRMQHNPDGYNVIYQRDNGTQTGIVIPKTNGTFLTTENQPHLWATNIMLNGTSGRASFQVLMTYNQDEYGYTYSSIAALLNGLGYNNQYATLACHGYLGTTGSTSLVGIFSDGTNLGFVKDNGQAQVITSGAISSYSWANRQLF